MKWRVIGAQAARDWHDVLARMPETDIYFCPEYHKGHELNGDGEARAFVFEDEDQVLFYPFLIRRIEKVDDQPVDSSLYDIETVYGYSGPLCTTSDAAFLASAWGSFATWCYHAAIVAEFLRFNPLIGNHRFAGDTCSMLLDRETVALNLECSEEQLWQGYPSTQRNMVRKAIKKGLAGEEVTVAEGFPLFQRLYRETMNRLEADQYYHFSDSYFEHLQTALAERVKLFLVRHQDRVIAAALYLLHDDRIHYHLAGSDPNYRGLAPNNLLLHTAALWARGRGFRWLHLGGGRTSGSADSLFAFKASISDRRFPFYVGKRVHNKRAYDQLCQMWMRHRGVGERPNYFLLYRLETQLAADCLEKGVHQNVGGLLDGRGGIR